MPSPKVKAKGKVLKPPPAWPSVPKDVTVSLERMDFREPVYIGDILAIKATVRHVGRTSMLVGIRVEAENPTTGEVRHTASCYMTFVALDRNNKPTVVPGVVASTPDEKAKMEKAKRVAEIIKASRADQLDKM